MGGRRHINDSHAATLHLLGFDHEKLTFRFAGQEMQLAPGG